MKIIAQARNDTVKTCPENQCLDSHRTDYFTFLFLRTNSEHSVDISVGGFSLTRAECPIVVSSDTSGRRTKDADKSVIPTQM